VRRRGCPPSSASTPALRRQRNHRRPDAADDRTLSQKLVRCVVRSRGAPRSFLPLLRRPSGTSLHPPCGNRRDAERFRRLRTRASSPSWRSDEARRMVAALVVENNTTPKTRARSTEALRSDRVPGRTTRVRGPQRRSARKGSKGVHAAVGRDLSALQRDAPGLSASGWQARRCRPRRRPSA